MRTLEAFFQESYGGKWKDKLLKKKVQDLGIKMHNRLRRRFPIPRR